MCGIAGIIHLDGKAVHRPELDVLTDALAHRGPDGRGTYIHRNVGLGHRRLSILDLSDAAHQPMVSMDGQTVLVFNGEIYNFQEKRRMLEERGHIFHSSGDTEVLLKLYEEFGEECLRHLRGMFAFAVHDLKRNTVFLARDRVGKKPIKYFCDGKTFAFASELKALRTLADCPHAMDEQAVHHFLTMMYLPAPLTGIANIHKLPAAHALMIDLNKGAVAEPRRYWSLSYKTNNTKSLDDWKAQTLALFSESVKLRMIADVPVGAFLSGGIDSAAVVALMSQMSPHPVKTFSIGTAEETHNELPDAMRIALTFKTDHHPIIVQPDIVHLLPELVRAYEEPYADPSAIPMYLLARETRKTVTVALNGDGGDENFAGYVRYPILRFSEQWAQIPRFMHSLIAGGTSTFHRWMQTTFSYRCDRFQHSIGLPWEQRYLQYLSFFTEEEKRALYRSGFADGFQRTDAWYAGKTSDARARADDLIHRALSMDLDTYLADDLLPKVDRATMASGLEARSPLLDHHLLEFTASMPIHYKLHGSVRKWIFKEILQSILPPEHLRRRKTGFRLPLDTWFRGELRGFVRDRLLSTDSKMWQIFDRTKMERFLDHYDQTSIDYSDHVWALLWLDEWMRQYT